MSVAATFDTFCGIGHADMDGKTFAKLCKDCSLIDRDFTATDVDLLFAKVVPKGQRRMSITEFTQALGHIAQRKKVPSSDIESAVAACAGPSLQATQADTVRFHDDKSTYTGTHASSAPAPTGGVGPIADEPKRRHLERPPSRGAAGRGQSRPPTDAAITLSAGTQEAFKAFCGNGHSNLDGKTFAKLCKDSQLLDSHFTATDADLVFAKAVPHGHRRMSQDQFATALGYVAQKKIMSADAVQAAVANCGGPVLLATRAEAVRFHDDQSTYTGTHATCGPGSIRIGTGSVASECTQGLLERRPSTGSLFRRPSSSSSTRAQKPDTPPVEVLSDTAAAVFKSFCGDGKVDMDGKSFAKLCKDCHLLDLKFTPTDADLIFAKVVCKGQRRMSCTNFAAALASIAARKSVSVSAIQAAVANCKGPSVNATVADAVRFHDDKNTYTGTHASVHGAAESVIIGAANAAETTVSDRQSSPSLVSCQGNNPSEPSVDGSAEVSDQSGLESAHVGSGFQAVRKIKRSQSKTNGLSEAEHESTPAGARLAADADRLPSPSPQLPPAAALLAKAFTSYAGVNGDMDGKTFVKLCKDCRLFNRKFTQTDADLAFAKIVTKGQRRISMQQFEALLAKVAGMNGMDYDIVCARVGGHASGPVLLGTKTEAVRFHDDKSTYTGTHVFGGPASVAVGAGSLSDQSWKRQ
jgi:hypothetical protein